MTAPHDRAFGRRLVWGGLALGALLTAGCTTGPRVPRFSMRPGEPVSAGGGEGFVVLGARRLTRERCTDYFWPAITITAPQGSEPARRSLGITTPNWEDWVPDASRPGALRNVYLLKLPAGTHAVTGWGFDDVGARTSFSSETRPWRFEVLAERVTYVGGLGVAPDFRAGFFECSTGRGQIFQFSDLANDIALARQRWPELNAMEIVDRSGRPPGWARGPVGFD